MADAPFIWGSNGEQLSPGAASARRRVAEALMAQGADYSPIRSWTQGLARVANGLVGGLQMRDLDQQDTAREAKTQALLLGNPALGGAAPAAAAPAPTTPASAPAASLDPETTGYVNNAATKFGVDPAYLTKTALLESGGKADATNPSGAAGLFQFMPKTAKEYGLDNPLDPEDSAMAAAELAADNRKVLATKLGRDPTNGELYLAHQQGADGASALLANPNAPAAQIIGRQAVLQNGGTEDMTSGQFANKWTSKFAPPAVATPGGTAVAAAQAAPVQMPSNDPSAAPAAKPGMTRVAAALASSPDNAALPAAATPTQGYAVPGQAAAPVAAPAVTPQIPPATAGYIKQLLANPGTREAGVTLLSQYTKPHESYSQSTDADGNIWSVNNTTGQRTIAKAAETSTGAQKDFEYGQSHPDFVAQQLAKTKAGAAQLNNNVDLGTGQSYDKLMIEGLGKSHAALSNGVEDAQQRLRDVNGMQAAMDAIQKNGGTTGGLGAAQVLELKKTLNAGATTLGMGQPFDENSLSDAELMQKLNRQMAGAQAKNAVGARVTNFDMQNYLAANPGLSLSPTANQRLLGIQSQVENRNVAVGNAIRNATAQATAAGQRINPQTIQSLIEQYDELHHVRDPVSGQDLTKSYGLPDLQTPSSNDALAVGHETNINGIKIKRVN